MSRRIRTVDFWAKIAVAVITLVGPAIVTIAVLTQQWILIVPGAIVVIVPLFRFPQLRRVGTDHPRPIIAGLLCLFGLLFLGYLTPLFGSFFVSQPTISSVSNRLVFAVAWLPVNNYPQTIQVNFNTIGDQFMVIFTPNGVNDKAHQNITGILYVTEPFAIRAQPFPSFGNWSYGQGAMIFGPSGWHVRLDYNFTSYSSQHYPCGNNGLNCEATFDTESMVRTDLNGAVSMELQYKSENGGSINICGLNPCNMTSKNMTVAALVALPHDTSSLQFSPTTTNTVFNQAYTNLEWNNLTSAVVLSYISPQILAQYQFFILTSGIFVSTGVAMQMDAIAKWIERKKHPRDTSVTRHEVKDNFSKAI